MTYLDNFEQNNSNENLSWCKPYTDKNEEYYLVMYEGEAEAAKTPEGTYHRYNSTLSEEVKESIAKAVNNGYHCYHGWNDEDIALDVMHEIGCKDCPFKHECEAVNEEMNGLHYV
jgi:hypothetical protein